MKTVLIVDDERNIRDSLGAVLRDEGFEVIYSRKKSGTGLGLAIVSNIIADHNGYIRVKDNVPKGTRFVIELPVRAGMI